MNYASLSNYYEHIVYEYISEVLAKEFPDEDDEFFLDVACYALARLPARYMRHEVDMMFYLAEGERNDMNKEVKLQVTAAATFIKSRQKSQQAEVA